jgi:hypothetical protein
MKERALVLYCAALGLVPATASAEVASEAGFFDAVARRAYQAGQYEQALESFQLVQEIAPSLRVLYNIALCADLAGRSDMAFSLYQEYLQGADPDAARRAAAEARSVLLKPKLALLAVESDPSGASIYVDRKELGQFGVTPSTLALSEGEHRLLLERAGFAPESVPIVVQLGSLATTSVSLPPLLGEVSVELRPASGTLQFLRNGVPFLVSLAEGVYRLPAGEYQMLATAPGYVPTQTPIVVHESARARQDVTLLPLPRALGRLLVSTGQLAADVFLDGQRVAVTPATLEDLAVGEHTLEVRAQGRVAQRKVTIKKGRASYIEINLGSPAP